MSHPTPRLVTIDDPVTIIEAHRVLLEWVDQVHREFFHTRSNNLYRHDQEGTTWARGHHLPDSEVVVALRAAASLVPQKSAAPVDDPTGMIRGYMGGGNPGVDNTHLRMLIAESRKAVDDARKAAEQTKKSWWQIHWRSE